MGRPKYADVQWLRWLIQIGVVDGLQDGRLPDDLWPLINRPTPSSARFIMDRCIEVPAAYWPQIVAEECNKLLLSGIDGETVRRVRRWLERELTLS